MKPSGFELPALLRRPREAVVVQGAWVYDEDADLNMMAGTPAVNVLGPTQTQTLTEVRAEVPDAD